MTKEDVFIALIDKQFELAGHDVTTHDALEDDNWYQRYTITKDQRAEFTKWGIDYISKKLRINKFKGRMSAKRYMASFDASHGLKERQ